MTIIQNGTLVSSSRIWKADLAMENGKITAMEDHITPSQEDTVFDASGCLIFPGFIDPHTHLDMDSGVTVTADDFPSGTLAAVCGGTTTLVDFATQDKGKRLKEALDLWHQKADGKSSCNYAFHMAITDWNETTKQELAEMVEAGVTSIKVYLAYDALRVNDGELLDILRQCKALGLQVGCHCENGDVVNFLQKAELQKGNCGPAAHPVSRPAAVEAEAVSRYCQIAAIADCPVTVVHLSSKDGLEEVRKARQRGQTVWVETCPQYLLLDETCYQEDGFESAKYVMSPPLRSEEHVKILRQAIADGEVDTVATDHCSYNFGGQKTIGAQDFTKIPNGAPGLEHRPALFFSSFIARGTLPPQKMCELLSENPAKLYGMYPKKGSLTVGADADITVWDPNRTWTISAANHHHKVDYTPYEGMSVTGQAKAVFVNGILAAKNGQPVHMGCGEYVYRETLK